MAGTRREKREDGRRGEGKGRQGNKSHEEEEQTEHNHAIKEAKMSESIMP